MPNFLDRAISFVSPTIALNRAVARDRLKLFGYDAANPGNARGSSGGRAKNAASESPRMAQDRVKLMWDARDLERNMPVIRCILDRIPQYVCGVIKYQANTGDHEFDLAYESYFESWCEQFADVTGRYDFRTLVELGFRSSLRDGDFGFAIIRQGPTISLQSIEADRIGNLNTVGSSMNENHIQGITIDGVGRPIAYDVYKRIRRGSSYELEAQIAAQNFIHLTRPIRTDEYRTTSFLAPVIGQARDLYEMFAFERGAAKWAASIAGIIKVNDPLAKGPNSSAGVFDGIKADGTPSSDIQANRLLRLRPNEDVTPFNTGSRPSGAFGAYIEMALRDISMGLNVPYGFFDMSKFGGATVRLEAMQLQRMFARNQQFLVRRVLNPIRDAVLQNAIADGELPAIGNWRGGRWQFGANLTADTGYDTDANLQMVANGMATASKVVGDTGENYEDVVDTMIKEAAYLRDQCAAAGIPIELVAGARFPNATQQIAAANQAMVPEVAPSINDIGEGGAKAINDVIDKVSTGMMTHEEGVALLVNVYGFAPDVASQVLPEEGHAPAEVTNPGVEDGDGNDNEDPADEADDSAD